jgi:hypothetical protein
MDPDSPDTRLFLSHLAGRLKDAACSLERGHPPVEVAKILRQIATKVEGQRRPLEESANWQTSAENRRLRRPVS